MARHNDIGRWGEDLAAEHMEQEGWYIRHRDWHCGHIDIDLVCIDEHDTTLVFVEVKTRSRDRWGDPTDAVDIEKKRRMLKAANAYVLSTRKENRSWRYDIISIVGTPETGHQLRHIENAFHKIDVFEWFATPRRERKSNPLRGISRLSLDRLYRETASGNATASPGTDADTAET